MTLPLIRRLLLLLVLAGLPLPPAVASVAAQAPRRAAATDHYLIADYDNNRVIEIDQSGAVVWRYGEPTTKGTLLEAPTRAFRLANGNVMIVDNGEILQGVANPRLFGRVLEVNPTSNAVVQSVFGLFLPTDVQVLDNGKWLISELSSYRRRVIEVTPSAAGTRVDDSTPAIYSVSPKGAGRPAGIYSAVRLSNGNTVISDHGTNKVVEINGSGTIIRQKTTLASPTRVTVTAAGTWLIPEKGRQQVIEYNPDTGQTIKVMALGDTPGSPDSSKFWVGSAERLPDGTTLVADGENNRVVLFDSGGRLTTTLPQPTGNLGDASGATNTCGSISSYGCPRDATFIDTTAPTVTLNAPPTSSTSQRVQLSVTAGDRISAIEYSLDGTTYATAATLTPQEGTITQTIDVDLANPAVGGSWTDITPTIRVRVRDSSGATTVATHSLAFSPGTLTARYLAEGYTGGTFDEYLTLANPSGSTVYVSATFQYANGSSGPPGTVVEVPANQRRTVLIDDVAGTGKELSLKLESNAQFYAERPMYFSSYPAASGSAYGRPGASALSGISGGHVGAAAAATAGRWSFAEGTTRDGFEVYFTLQNPTISGTSSLRITYYFTQLPGEPVAPTVTKTVDVLPASRKTVRVHDPSDAAGVGSAYLGRDFSATVAVDSGPNIIAERVMYFRYNGTITGGSANLGATAPGRAWYFAEGYTGVGFDEYLTIQNPGGTAGTATITYYVAGQITPETRTVPLPANSRTTVIVHEPSTAGNTGGLGRGTAGTGLEHSTRITSDVDIVAERPIYFTYGGGPLTGVDGGHNVVGATSLLQTNQSVVLAEGTTRTNFHEYLTFQNPNNTPASVAITYLKADGTTAGPYPVTLAANQRTTVAVHNAADPTGAGLGTNGSDGFDTAVKVRVAIGGAAGVLVERVMYFKYGGTTTGGSAAFGVLLTP